ncbi:hypothetical protein ACFWDF_30715 [Streptomyces diastaticus]|uniref:hypothetical protein n=1 Tax=Streptomyces diastaticus TaxID=1956 RepID=UPI0036837CB1
MKIRSVLARLTQGAKGRRPRPAAQPRPGRPRLEGTVVAARPIKTPLLVPAVALSVGSLAWTTWSLVDLLGAGAIGLTVAIGADVIWGSVIVAEARGVRVAGRRWVVPVIGIVAMLAVAVFLAWHGTARGSVPMAVVGPFLPLGAKVIWMLALADMRDPAALTDDEQIALAELERGLVFEQARHEMKMRRLAMEGDFLLAKVSVDFDLELARQEKSTELWRRRPIELPGMIERPALEPADDDDPDPDPDGGSRIRTSPGPDPERPSIDPEPAYKEPLPTPAGPMTMRDAVRTALDSGISDPDAVLRYVRTVADANAKADTVSRYLRTLRRTA